MKNKLSKNRKINRKFEKGISLISLVVTIIVLLILSGATMTMVLGENGVIREIKSAVDKVKEDDDDTSKEFNGVVDEMDAELGKDVNIQNPQPTVPEEFDGKVNIPKLGTGMTPVKWTENKWEKTTPEDTEWYNYSEKKWANAVTEKDGVESYWVWIPRYAYKITSGYNSNNTGKIEIVFLKGQTNKYDKDETEKKVEVLTTEQLNNKKENEGPTSGGTLVVHPAFEADNGNTQLSGIWVAKYEASHSDAKIEGESIQKGVSENLSIRPNVTSWRESSVSSMYEVCQSYSQALNSHLIKNIEWGAVSYLAQSEYGLGATTQIGVNECSDFITGAGPKGAFYSYKDLLNEEEKDKFLATGIEGQKASTTGNVWGVYDMSGGSWEYVAACLTGYSELTNKSSSMIDIYEGTDENSQTNYTANKNKYGDAIWETSNSGDTDSELSWFNDSSSFLNSTNKVLKRGGYFADDTKAGLFSFSSSNGESNENIGFRPALIIY